MVVTADVAVVGLGAMGAAALYQLASRGIAAIGIDRFAPPHDQGSSHGETRITRQAVGEGQAYVPLVLRSHAIWRDLEAATGRSLLVACGGLMIGPPEHGTSHHGKKDFLGTTIAMARRFAIRHEVLDSAEIARRFPQFTGLAETDTGYYEPGAGFLHPEACIAAQLGEAERRGAQVLRGTVVTGLRQDGRVVRIETSAGAIEASRAIVAAGAWTAPLLGSPFAELLKVSRQVLHWFDTADAARFTADACPIYIRMWGPGDGDYFYGFPIPAGSRGVKVATEQQAIATTAATINRVVAPEEAAAFHARQLAGRLAGVTPRVLRSAACLYTTTPDSDFLIDTHPTMPHVTVISACSGHGFKHSAAIGEAVVQDAVEGASRIDLSAFRLKCRDTAACPAAD